MFHKKNEKELLTQLPEDLSYTMCLFLDGRDLSRLVSVSKKTNALFNPKSEKMTIMLNPDIKKTSDSIEKNIHELKSYLLHLKETKNQVKLAQYVMSDHFEKTKKYLDFSIQDLFRFALDNNMIHLVSIILHKRMVSFHDTTVANNIINKLVKTIESLDVTTVRTLAKAVSHWISHGYHHYFSPNVLWKALNISHPSMPEKRLQIAIILQSYQLMCGTQYNTYEYIDEVSKNAYKENYYLAEFFPEDVHRWQSSLVNSFRISLHHVTSNISSFILSHPKPSNFFCCISKKIESLNEFKNTVDEAQKIAPQSSQDLVKIHDTLINAINIYRSKLLSEKADSYLRKLDATLLTKPVAAGSTLTIEDIKPMQNLYKYQLIMLEYLETRFFSKEMKSYSILPQPRQLYYP